MATAADRRDYALPQEFLDFRETIRKMVVERVAPRAAEIDAKGEYPRDLRELFAEHDLFGLPFEVEHGGTGTGTLMLNIAVEEVAKACASSALMLMIQELGTLPIRLFGTEEQKGRLLPKCAAGEWTPAFALSEPDAGSDPGGMRTRAVRDGVGLGDRRDQELDHEPRGRRLLRGLLRHRPRRRPLARDLRLRRRGRPAGLLGRQARAQDGDPRLADRPADLRRRPGPGREPDRRRERRLQGRDGDAGPFSAGSRRAGRRHLAGGDRLRRRLRSGAPPVRKADRLLPGDPVQARRDGDPHRGRKGAPLPRLRQGRRRRPATWASTRRWRSCSPPTRRCG